METTSFSHTGNIGDVWAAIPAMRQWYISSGKKVDLYLVTDTAAVYYPGAVHPTKNSNGDAVMLNESMVNMMKPLLLEQECINDVKIWAGEGTKVRLEDIRDTFVGMPNGSINRWYFYVFPDLACDLSGKWLNVPSAEKDYANGKIIITRSERYTNERIDYSFLKPYEEDLLFCGTMREYNNFCMRFDLNIRKFNITNFLELAQAIKQCKFHITNQTQAFQLSDGQKTPRILELCSFAPNCIPIGENAYDFFSQQALEYYFHKLNGTLEQYIKFLQENNPTA